MEYNFSAIEQKWQKEWEAKKLYKVENDFSKPKYYVLDMFPYPSGAGLHVGHPLGYIASDIFARYKRLKGYNVLHPMGFDAFGLPAEQYAIETGQHPQKTTEENIQRYREQLDKIGFCFDWDRAVKTSDPNYYKWTQWIFIQLFNSYYDHKSNKASPIEKLINDFETTGCQDKKNNFSASEWNSFSIGEKENILMQYRLAYKAYSLVNWCEALGTVLANDEVVNGVSERGGHPVERKKMSQWFLRITDYAERLLQSLDGLDYPEPLKEMQRNWIGKSTGAELYFNIENSEAKIKVYTTRPDTIFGCSFLVLAPEHELVEKICSDTEKENIIKYVEKSKIRSERERISDNKNVSGAFTGAYAVHPFTKEKLPIWIADYVLANYGTGAIMAVPAGDDRDFAFAKEYQLAIPKIFNAEDGECLTDKNEKLIASDFLTGKNYYQAFDEILSEIEKKEIGNRKLNYKMRDAGFSRQRYWGEPFPILKNKEGRFKIEEELPLLLPKLDKYEKGPQGKGPLANLNNWVEQDGWERETDTMPGYAGSSWYYLRYMDPKNESIFCDKNVSAYWNQVDVYIGGAEHAVGHLLYSRFWCKFLFDLDYISFEEPYKKLINQGMIQGNSRLVYRKVGENCFVSDGLKAKYQTEALHIDVNMCDGKILDIEKFKTWRKDFATATFELEDGKYYCGSQTEKMSKRLYNVVNPDEIVANYGADTFRMYEMFLGPLEDSKPWDTKGIEGVHRFLKKYWRLFFQDEKFLVQQIAATEEEKSISNKSLEKIEMALNTFSLNTAVSQFMIWVNELSKLNYTSQETLRKLTIALSPFAPHICEELWQAMGNQESILTQTFPEIDHAYLKASDYNYPVAINGKVKIQVNFSADLKKDDLEALVKTHIEIQKLIAEQIVKKYIVVPGRMINIVI